MRSVIAQGSPSARFQRALATGNPLIATAAAAELPRVSLAEALGLVLVYRDAGDRRFERSAVRWHGRLCLEVGELAPDDVALALAALRGLTVGDGKVGAVALRTLLIAYGQDGVAKVLERWLEKPRSERLRPSPKGGGGVAPSG
jgi:hypothetical protein